MKTIALLSLLTASALAAPDKPNVIIIYGDDVGYGDVGVYGSKLIPTPNIDRLANEGLRFTDGHCPAATCSASRYAMLTGRLAMRLGIAIFGPSSPLPIGEDEFTLPKVFKQAGYRTAVIGKWHLGLGSESSPVDWNGAVKPGPLEIGFDYSFLLPNTNDRVPCVYLENHHVVNHDPDDPISIGEKLFENSTDYPDGRANPEAMTYYRNTHGHNETVINGIGRLGKMWGGEKALWNDETMADEFVNRTRAWLKKHRAGHPDTPFFLYFSSQDIHVPRAPHPRFQRKTGLSYRGDAMVQFDWSTGAIMDLLDELGIADDTMIILSSDNGPVYDDGYDDGTTVHTSTEEGDRGHDASGPYRGGKYQIYEGGTRVPFIVRWPAKIKPGVSDALVTHTDFIASFAALLDVEVPEGEAADSQNAIEALIGGNPDGNRFIIEENNRFLALRDGDWKLIATWNKDGWFRKGRGKQGTAMELYNLADDAGEKHDLAGKHPEIEQRLADILRNIIEGEGVVEAIEDAAG